MIHEMLDVRAETNADHETTAHETLFLGALSQGPLERTGLKNDE